MEVLGEECHFERLPEECVSHVLSLTSPRDACRSALVSSAFCSAAGSDATWARFLPSDLDDILPRAVDPVGPISRKELYLRLCDSILIDGGRKSFSLEKHSGAKSYTLSARQLWIVWGDHPHYWKWVSHPESRFAEVAELLDVCWLDLGGEIDSRELSQHTAYKAYLVFKLAPRSYGLERRAQEVSVRVGAHISRDEVYLQPIEEDEAQPAQRVPHVRNDGWTEIELGEFFNEDGGEGEVFMTFREVRSMHWKKGIIVEGIQVRPS